MNEFFIYLLTCFLGQLYEALADQLTDIVVNAVSDTTEVADGLIHKHNFLGLCHYLLRSFVMHMVINKNWLHHDRCSASENLRKPLTFLWWRLCICATSLMSIRAWYECLS